MPTKWQHLRRTADHLRHLLESESASEVLDPEERDWAAILRDRLYEECNRRPKYEQ